MKIKTLHVAVVMSVALVAGACTGSIARRGDDEPSSRQAADAAVPIPPPDSIADTTAAPERGTIISTPPPPTGGSTAALIDADRQLAVVEAGVVKNTWMKWDAFPSPDRTAAVLTLDWSIEGLAARPVQWIDLPAGSPIAQHDIAPDLELTATSLDGAFAGVTSRAGEPIAGAIAGSRRVSRVQIVGRDEGVVFEQELDGNFEPEAFSSRLTADGIPALVFLLEYFPADTPRFYRVRVLSTETGDVSLPLNLRDKQEQVDERMAGFSRSQVVANDHGLLFTLYRGTIDGTPDGEPYAFVHTLDFADGVWCLDVDPRLELDRVPGSLAVGGDRLYVASANGRVGSYPIPSITDPTRSPSMDWVAEAVGPSDVAPVIAADTDVVHVADPARPGFVAHVHDDGLVHPAVEAFDGAPTAVDQHDGVRHAVGDDWATFELISRPDWLDEIEVLVVG